MKRLSFAIAVLALGGTAYSRPGGAEVAIAGDAQIVGLDGTIRAATTLADLDTIVATGDATLRAPLWSARLSRGTRGVLRTELLQGQFYRLFELVQGTAKLDGAWTLRAGTFVLRAQAASVEASYQNGLLIINVGSGDTVVITGTSASITLKNGQKLTISYDPATGIFTIVVEEDNGSPIDVKIGKTTFQVSKGDTVTARVSGDDLFVNAVAGDVSLVGPDGNLVNVPQGGQATVVGGGAGAVRPGIPAPINLNVPAQSDPPSPKPNPYKNPKDVMSNS